MRTIMLSIVYIRPFWDISGVGHLIPDTVVVPWDGDNLEDAVKWYQLNGVWHKHVKIAPSALLQLTVLE